MPNPDTLSVELQINEGNAEVVVGRAKQKLEDFVSYAEKAQPQIKFSIPNQNFIDLDKLEKRAEETRKSFQQITSTRLDAGNIGNLTKEIVRASERSRQLQSDISSIKKELANPNRKSSIAFLTEELRAAEKEAEQLNRKLSSLPTSGGGTASIGTKSSGLVKGKRGSNTEFTRAALEVVDDFVPAGFNRPFNAVSKEMLAISTLSTATLATFGGIAAVGYGIVKITQNIREEAERRLKVEEGIAIAVNKQILGQQEAVANLKKLRAEASEGREFNQFLGTSTVDELKKRRANLEQLQNLTPALLNGKPNEDYQKNSQQILELDRQIVESQQRNTKLADDAFNQRWESYKKSQENIRNAEDKAEKRRQEQAEKFAKSVEQGLDKVNELERKYNSVFDSLYQKQGANNPFVAVFSEADKSLKSLKENLKGLSPELQSFAVEMQQKLNFNALFETRLNNKLDVFDLQERAKDLRNTKLKIDDPNKFFNDYIEFGTKELEKQAREIRLKLNPATLEKDNTFGGYLQRDPKSNALVRYNVVSNKDGSFGGFSQSDARNELLNVYERLAGGGTISRRKTFADLTEADKRNFVEKSSIDASLNERLQKQLSIIYSGAFSDDQKAIADRKLVGLTNNLNPNELTSQIREAAALANEREAVRKSDYERQALEVAKKQLEVQTKLTNEIAQLRKVAQKEGLQGVKNIVEIVDKTNGSIKVLGATPTQEDVKRTYLDEYDNQ